MDETKSSGVVFLVTLVLVLPAMAWGGFVASTIWGWFAVPIFGLPALGVWSAAGLIVFVGLLTDKPEPPSDDEPAERAARTIAHWFVGPAFYLLLAWVAKTAA